MIRYIFYPKRYLIDTEMDYYSFLADSKHEAINLFSDKYSFSETQIDLYFTCVEYRKPEIKNCELSL